QRTGRLHRALLLLLILRTRFARRRARLAVERIAGRRYLGQPDRLAVLDARVGSKAGHRAAYLFEEEDVTDLEAQRPILVAEGGTRRPSGQAALVVLPGVEADSVVRGIEGNRVAGLEDLGPGLDGRAQDLVVRRLRAQPPARPARLRQQLRT